MGKSKSQRTYGRHGHAAERVNTPEYAIWKAINQRCHNPRHKQYPSYGCAGIRVCDRWRGPEGFNHFLQDVGPQPFEGAGIRRHQPDRDYEPSNVFWGDTRRCRMLSYKGRSLSVAGWARELGVDPAALYTRLHMGWSVADVLGRYVRPRCSRGFWDAIRKRKSNPELMVQDATPLRD